MLLKSLALIMVKPLPGSSRNISLSKIKILPTMLSHPPKPYKIAQRYTYYLHNREFQSPIILDHNYNLIDGYITYLIAKMMGCKTVTVKFANDSMPKLM